MSDATGTRAATDAERAPPELSVVVPVYNEAECVGPLCDAIYAVLSALGRSFEVLLVDDGSSDDTPARLAREKSRREHLCVFRFRRNCGQSAAMSCGFDHARGRIVVTLDADLQNDPADIARLLEGIDSGEWDVVCGWRRQRQDSWLRRISSRIANAVRNRLSGETISDTGCSLKAYRTDFLRKIKVFSGMHRFLPTVLKMEGARVTEIPVHHRPRLAGKAKYGVWNRIFRSFRDLLAVRWMKARHIRYESEEI
ncbi:MAG: glycosyltransferase family 2 protein [Planctomycetes bacterium]|nr:glycosyltransferase family 2 protein [Planctomycetota bacterium]